MSPKAQTTIRFQHYSVLGTLPSLHASMTCRKTLFFTCGQHISVFQVRRKQCKTCTIGDCKQAFPESLAQLMARIYTSRGHVTMEKLISIANPFTASMYKVKALRLLLILAMVDSKKRIIDLEAGWPGSVGDGRIWNCSTLKNTMTL